MTNTCPRDMAIPLCTSKNSSYFCALSLSRRTVRGAQVGEAAQKALGGRHAQLRVAALRLSRAEAPALRHGHAERHALLFHLASHALLHLPVAAQKDGLGVRVQQSFHSFLGVRRLQELVQLDRVARVRDVDAHFSFDDGTFHAVRFEVVGISMCGHQYLGLYSI